jgi:hypothetical protein
MLWFCILINSYIYYILWAKVYKYMVPCLCIMSIVLHGTMCYNIDAVRERNKPKTSKQNPLPVTNKFIADTKKRKSKMKWS